MTPEAARTEFPVLSGTVYLNSNSMGATPRGARVAASRYFDVVERWRDERYEELAADVARYAADLAALIGGTPSSVVLDVNVSTLFGRLLSTIDWAARPRAVTTDLEFPSAEVALRGFRRYGCEPVVVPSREGRAIDAAAVCAAIDERTSLVFVSHATYGTGALTDVAAIARRARQAGALVVVDAYQSVGVVPVDVDAMGADVLLGGSHKWLCGAFDCAFAWVRPSVLGSLEPAATGWMATQDPFAFSAAQPLAGDARRLGAGTPALLPAIASREGLGIVRAVGMRRIREMSLARTARIMARADEAGIEVLTPREAERRGGVVTVRVARGREVAASLVRDGFVCSHRAGLRIAPHFYNTDEEIERFMDALVARVRGTGGA